MTEKNSNFNKYYRHSYDCFPSFSLAKGVIAKGYNNLVNLISSEIKNGLRVLIIDGFNGVDWDTFCSFLTKSLSISGIESECFSIEECLNDEEEINRRIKPFLGGDDPLFGHHYPLGLELFFNPQKIAEFRDYASEIRANGPGKLTIFYGCGSGLLELKDRLWYIDKPKDYIQSEARRGKVRNFGSSKEEDFSIFYKRSYFVDWPALNRLKRQLLPEINLLIDLKNSREPVFISGEDFRNALYVLSETPFRVRPWFSPGPWGGKFMQEHMGLDPLQPNFAWSFELIVPENSIMIDKDGISMEFSFDWLMFGQNIRVLGEKAAIQFRYEWPIRLDYLDTIDGDNLSIQVHPRPNYIRKEFGETYTQDETYYIIKTKGDSRVYLGLKESCSLTEFKTSLTNSIKYGKKINIDRFVNSEPSKPHDLFLIPNGTVHGSGKGNLVLEISATPYIFTFKIYDYLRKDLEGNLRPINVERAFENIRPERTKDWVDKTLIAQPRLINQGNGWNEYVLYDSTFTYYNIHRLDFETFVEYETKERALVINMVEGDKVEVKAENGRKTTLSWLETMLIPAATSKIKIKNLSIGLCKIVLVYIKPGAGINFPLNTPAC